ncbi:GT2 family glycosyltransferase [Acetoanaerobium pronyense]|uniref:GT2 family glycosyltransferase n=1 Tax=Acetoanaerobium pronyense TaxID=1482736 RepID=A0ABS4KH71_9FIRM|nr:glycosyltransferase family 2 protein [Acetoanaerobium pronyense]MBP2027133.1 GT2 family glycosyltransferase [Acetoanaerobium pronyense]
MVSIVIPNYNGKHFLEKCLDSIENQSYKDIETIIIDNASDDGSVDFLRDRYPKVKLTIMDTNTGFSGAVNEGIKSSRGEFVFLLNNDTEIDESCVENLVNAINKDNKIFSVNAKMIQFNNRDLLDDAGDEYNSFGWAFKRGFNQNIGTNKVPRRVFSCCAGASLYRKEVFNHIGYFDELFFAYLEDVDIGFRANCYGYKNYFCPDAIVYHIISGTTGNKKTEFKTKLSARNNVYLLYKNLPLLLILINLPFLIIGALIKSVFFSKHGLGKNYLKESMYALKDLRKLNKVDFKIPHMKNYLWIQFKLIINVPVFILERIKILLT